MSRKVRASLGGCRTVNEYVDRKVRLLDTAERSFSALFEMMFSEENNVMYEESRSYRLIRRTYGEVKREILARSAAMHRLLGDLPGDAVVGIYMENSLDWIETFWCVLRCGFRPLLMNLRLGGDRLADALASSGARAVISDGKRFDLPAFTPADFPPEGEFAAAAFGSEILLMSSGTSERLKLCAYSAEEFFCQIRGSGSIIRESRRIKQHYDGSLKLLTFLPFYHIFGLVAVYIWFTFFSRTLVRLNDLSPDTILATVRRHKVTHIFAVPLFWEKVRDAAMKGIRRRGPETAAKFEKGMKISRALGDSPAGRLFSAAAFREVRQKMFGSSVRFMITGGSRIDPAALEFFNAVGYHLADGYGMTEIGITSVELSERRSVRCAGFVGRPMEGVSYRISDEGHLLVSGGVVARRILSGGEPVPLGEWFDTMDLAECVGGRYRILGRADDMIVSRSGENLHPTVAEEALSVPGVRGLCLVGADVPALLVSVSKYASAEELSALEAELRKKADAAHLTGQIGRTFFTTDDLIAPGEFKLNRARLLADYTEGRLTPAGVTAVRAQAGERGSVAAFIADRFAEALGRDASGIPDDADFFADLGGSSLDYLGVIAALQDEFDIPFPASGDGSAATVEGLAAIILGKD